MVNIAVLGYGVVGSGVVEVIELNKKIILDRVAISEINIKRILDLRDFTGSPVEKIITKNIDDILDDDSISIVVEVMGGVNPSYEYVKKALLRGKSVVTSNKELVSRYGAELLNIAKDRQINFLFEASVCGAIPIIRPIKQSITADDIFEIKGILNGTTNYILSKMAMDGDSFLEALEQAQAKGYAEKNPTADVEGHDTGRKLAILLSLITGKNVSFDDICIQGISSIKKEDIFFAKQINGAFKLIASAKKSGDKFVAYVAPKIVLENSPLYNVNGVFNSVLLRGNAFDELMFYGRGAGKLPTASAVVGDIVDAIRHNGKNIGYFWSSEPEEITSPDNLKYKRFVRIKFSDKQKVKIGILTLFKSDIIIEHPSCTDELCFITNEMEKHEVDKKLSDLENYTAEVCSVFEIESEV